MSVLITGRGLTRPILITSTIRTAGRTRVRTPALGAIARRLRGRRRRGRDGAGRDGGVGRPGADVVKEAAGRFRVDARHDVAALAVGLGAGGDGAGKGGPIRFEFR